MNPISKFIANLVIVPSLIKHIRNWPTFLLDHFKFKQQPYQIQLRNGLSIEVRPKTTDKGVVVEIFLLEDYKQAVKFIKNSEVVIDIGAQIGVFSLYAHNVNPKARILSFEPSSANFAMLQKNLVLNRATKVEPHQQAITSETKEFKLYLSNVNTGCHSLYRRTEKFETVQGLGINEVFERFNVTRCDLMKMDCEGAEAEIIRSIKPEHLSATRAIIMEYHDQATVSEMRARLEQSGFQVETPRFPLLFAWR